MTDKEQIRKPQLNIIGRAGKNPPEQVTEAFMDKALESFQERGAGVVWFKRGADGTYSTEEFRSLEDMTKDTPMKTGYCRLYRKVSPVEQPRGILSRLFRYFGLRK